jgi:hypothetical protein
VNKDVYLDDEREVAEVGLLGVDEFVDDELSQLARAERRGRHAAGGRRGRDRARSAAATNAGDRHVGQRVVEFAVRQAWH